MRMFRAETVWAVLLAQALAVVVCPSETVLCRTSDGNIKVESAVNGACSKQLHNMSARRHSRGPVVWCPRGDLGHHGPCSDTILSSDQDAECPRLLPIFVSDVVAIVAGSDDGVVVEQAVLAEPTDPPWQRPDLDMLCTVRLLV